MTVEKTLQALNQFPRAPRYVKAKDSRNSADHALRPMQPPSDQPPANCGDENVGGELNRLV